MQNSPFFYDTAGDRGCCLRSKKPPRQTGKKPPKSNGGDSLRISVMRISVNTLGGISYSASFPSQKTESPQRSKNHPLHSYSEAAGRDIHTLSW